jgi:hypothetical protein
VIKTLALQNNNTSFVWCHVIILGVVKFSDFGVQAFRLANLSIWTPNYSSMKIRKLARVEYRQNILEICENGGV